LSLSESPSLKEYERLFPMLWWNSHWRRQWITFI